MIAAAIVVNLAILEVISLDALRQLGKTLSVIAVTTVAVVLLLALVRAAGKS